MPRRKAGIMDAFVVTGVKRLKGRVRAGGAKNAALPIMAAALLADSPVRLKNVPNLADIRTMTRLLRELGMRVEREERSGDLILETADPSRITAPYSIMRTMRAGICVLGPLAARRGKAIVSLPGGCNIGDRPVDLHMKGLRALGAKIEIKHGYIHASSKRLRGSEMYLGGPFGSTVTGTANVLMAAVLAKGVTVIDCAACEPETQDVARMLVKMGASIQGIGGPRLIVEGVERLSGAEHTVIPDRIEAGTLLVAGAATGGDVTVEGARWNDLFALVHMLRDVPYFQAYTGRVLQDPRVRLVKLGEHRRRVAAVEGDPVERESGAGEIGHPAGEEGQILARQASVAPF